MRKIRSDSVLDHLPAEHKDKLEGWIIDEGLSLSEICERVDKQFGHRVSRDAVSRYHQRLKKLEETEAMRARAASLTHLPVGWEEQSAKLEAVVRYLTLQKMAATLRSLTCTPAQLCQVGRLFLALERQKLRQKEDERKQNAANFDEEQRDRRRNWMMKYLAAETLLKGKERPQTPTQGVRGSLPQAEAQGAQTGGRIAISVCRSAKDWPPRKGNGVPDYDLLWIEQPKESAAEILARLKAKGQTTLMKQPVAGMSEQELIHMNWLEADLRVKAAQGGIDAEELLKVA